MKMLYECHKHCMFHILLVNLTYADTFMKNRCNRKATEKQKNSCLSTCNFLIFSFSPSHKIIACNHHQFKLENIYFIRTLELFVNTEIKPQRVEIVEFISSFKKLFMDCLIFLNLIYLKS